MIASEENKGKVAVEIMGDICDWFKIHEHLKWEDFVSMQKNKFKELDKAINKDALVATGEGGSK